MAKAAVVLENKQRMSAQSRIRRIPVHRIGLIDVEVCDDGLPVYFHVSRRSEVSFLDVLQLIGQRLLRRASRTGIPLDGSLIHHDREREAGMILSFRHDQLCRLIDRIVRTVPVDDDAVDAAADHICDLALHLIRVGGTVADIHVLRPAKPKKQVCIDFRCCSRVEQRMDVDFADVAGAPITVRLTHEAVRGACVVGGLSGESRGGNHVRGTRSE